MPKKILVIEDEAIIARDIQKSLEELGYEVPDTATSGERAIKLAGEVMPDLVLMDIVLQGDLDGIEAAEEIKKLYDIPVIYLTAYADDKVMERAKVTEPFGYMIKPFEERELHTTIEIALYKYEIEKKLSESEELFRKIAVSAHDAIIMMDNRGNISYWNDAAEKMLGYSSVEVFGKELHMLLTPERYREAFKKGIAGFAETGDGPVVGQTLELAALKKDRTEIPVELSVSTMKMKERWYAIGIMRDITERKDLEAQLFQSQKMEAIGQLAAGMAHQLNTPLAVISTRLQLIQDDLKSMGKDSFSGQIQNILKNIEKMSTIIKGVLSFSRGSETGHEDLSINEVVDETLSFVAVKADETGVEISRHFSDDIPLLKANRNKLEQAFLNIVMNAFDAMPAGGRLTAGTGIKSIGEKDHVLVEFSDTGEGMEKEVSKNIFNPFFTTKPPGKGTGIGMAVSYRIIEDHNGSIQVTSDKGSGTAISILLPVVREGAEDEIQL